jgi:hypothetical protein
MQDHLKSQVRELTDAELDAVAAGEHLKVVLEQVPDAVQKRLAIALDALEHPLHPKH